MKVWKKGELVKWSGKISANGRKAVRTIGWPEGQVQEALAGYLERVKSIMERIRKMQEGWKIGTKELNVWDENRSKEIEEREKEVIIVDENETKSDTERQSTGSDESEESQESEDERPGTWEAAQIQKNEQEQSRMDGQKTIKEIAEKQETQIGEDRIEVGKIGKTEK
jgi:hypothetical protein